MLITIDHRLFLSTIKFSSTSEKFKLWSVAFQVLTFLQGWPRKRTEQTVL